MGKKIRQGDLKHDNEPARKTKKVQDKIILYLFYLIRRRLTNETFVFYSYIC